MNVLIVGGTGIISTAVANECLDRGYKLTLVNRGKKDSNRIPGVKYIVTDVRKNSLSDIKNLFDEYEYDVVIDFLSYNLNQLKKTSQIVDCKQYIFVSSASVYEESENHTYSEKSNKGNKKWKYCRDKYECECELPQIAKDNGFRYTIIRPYVTYSNRRFPYQFSPLEYYTIIYRVKKGLPIPILNKDFMTTITDSRDFAKGLVGLLGNESAYDTDFHITSDNHIRWKDVTDMIAKHFEVDCNYVELNLKDVENHKNTVIDIPEILYDKSRMMLFDNSKIKATVSDYCANRRIDDSIDDIVCYFEKKDKKIINYIWTGCLDRLIYESTGLKVKSEMYEYSSITDRVKYMIGRSGKLCYFLNVLKKIRHRVKKNY